jgi:hypothetical protein
LQERVVQVVQEEVVVLGLAMMVETVLVRNPQVAMVHVELVEVRVVQEV